MYTQCPKCRTVFHVTLEQLQTRDGVVRCGQCTHVFQADQHLYAEIPGETPKKNEKTGPVPAAKKPRRGGKSGAPAPGEHPPRRATRSAAQVQRAPEKTPATPTVHASVRTERRSTKHRGYAPQRLLVTRPLNARSAQHPLSVLWIVGGALFAILLTAQTAYFHRDALAEYPQLRPFIVAFCQQFGCTIRLSSDVGRIELIQPTGIAPHPRIGNALRLRATMVNRAQKSQPYPLMEVALTDSTGRALSRRTFMPREYLERPTAAEIEMSPNLAVSVLLDVTNPDGKAVGYQIDFVAPPLR